MKQLVLCFTAFVLAFSSLQAQSKKELSKQLSQNLETYRRYSLALNFDSSLLFMPPKMFEVIPLDTLKETMLQAMDNEYMTIHMTGFSFDTKSKPKIKKAGKYHWAYVKYQGSMQLVLKGEESFKKLLVPIMKGQFGEDNVQMEGESTMNIALKGKQLIAFKDPDASIWSIIEDKRVEKGPEGERQKMLLKLVLPEEVLKAIGEK